MKRILSFVWACASLSGSFAQNPTPNQQQSSQWETYPVKNVKKGMGRLNLVFPPGVEWSVDIYNSANKFITNHSINDSRNAGDTRPYYDLAPGMYHFRLNTVRVEHVPVEEGKETKLKTGVLDIAQSDRWELRSEGGQKFLTSGNKAKKIALPVGKYELKESGNKRLVDILEESGGAMNEKNIEGNYAKWVIKKPDSILVQDRGRLSFQISNGDPNWRMHQGTVRLSNTSSVLWKEHNDFRPGTYGIRFNAVLIENVPIIAGYQTRLKVGTLGLQNRTWKLAQRQNNGKFSSYSGWIPEKTKFTAPTGTYFIEQELGDYTETGFYYEIEVSDSLFIDLGPYLASRPPTYTYFWETFKIASATNEARLNLEFPEQASWKIEVLERGSNAPVAAFENNMVSFDKAKRSLHAKIAPGTYSLKISNVLIYTVMFGAGYETKIYTGVLDIASPGSWKLYRQRVSALGDGSFELIAEGDKPTQTVLPAGEYKLTAGSTSRHFTMQQGLNVKY